MATPSQRRVLGTLFLLLSVALAGVTTAAAWAHNWVVTAAAAILALWMFGLALNGLRPR